MLAQSFLTAAELAREAVCERARQPIPRPTELVGFTVREGLELLAPDNYLPTNPQLLEQTRAENGRNLAARREESSPRTCSASLKGLGPVGTEHVQGR